MEMLVLVAVFTIIAQEFTAWMNGSLPAWIKKITPVVIGISLCLLYGADILALGGYVPRIPYVGEVITGILVGWGHRVLDNVMQVLFTKSALILSKSKEEK